jgi:hypothetical protein
MSDHNSENSYTEEEREANSRVDAMAILAAVVVLVGLVTFYVAT